MEHRANADEQYLRSDTGDHQFVTLTQLLQAITSMYHVDEMFLWLTGKMVQHLKLEVAQIWTMDIAPSGQTTAILRATSIHDRSIPANVVTNTHIADRATTLLSERHSVQLQPVANLFPQYQSSLLGRYGLNYCLFSLTISSMAIPSVQGTHVTGNRTAPSIVAAFVFLTHPRPMNFLMSINQLLEQALLIAKRQGLLQMPPGLDVVTPDPNTQQRFLPPLHELIPVRTRPRHSMRSSSPFASSASISDKRAMAFLSAIDGSRNIFQIASYKKMNEKDVTEAIRILLRQERMQLYTSEGQLIDSAIFLNLL